MGLNSILSAAGLSGPPGYVPEHTYYAGSDDDVLYANRAAYSFADCQAHAVLPFSANGGHPVVALPGLTMISWSGHRDKYPVTGLGKTRVRGYTRGHRTSAVTLGFTISGETPWASVIKQYNVWRGKPGRHAVTEPDALPALDLSIVFSSPGGRTARVVVRSLTILDSGSSLGVQQIQLQETYSCLAASVSNVTLEETPSPVEGGLQGAGRGSNLRYPGLGRTVSALTETTSISTPSSEQLEAIHAAEQDRNLRWLGYPVALPTTSPSPTIDTVATSTERPYPENPEDQVAT